MVQRPVLLGHISGAHGIKGDVLVKTYTAAPEDIAAYGPLHDETGTRTLELEVLRVTPKGVIARVKGVTDRNTAEALKGTALCVNRDRLPKPATGEFYINDLIGLAAVAPDGAPVGEVIAVPNYGADDLLEIRLAGSSKTELVPFTQACVPVVDMAHSLIVVNLPTEVGADQTEGEG